MKKVFIILALLLWATGARAEPDLVPQTGWSAACSSESGFLHIIVVIQNSGDETITGSMLPFTVRMEGIRDGVPVPGASYDFVVYEPIPASGFYAIDNLNTGISAAELYSIFAPAIADDGVLTVRVIVDANNGIAETPSMGEGNNEMIQATACGLPTSVVPAEEGQDFEKGGAKKKPERKKQKFFK